MTTQDDPTTPLEFLEPVELVEVEELGEAPPPGWADMEEGQSDVD